MPMGTRHIVTGILKPGRWGLAVEIEGGGLWQIFGAPRSASRYLGQQVIVEGVRGEFDLLDLERFAPGDRFPIKGASRLRAFVAAFGWRRQSQP